MDNKMTEDELKYELEATKALLDITKNKLFTAISTINELELIIIMERDANKKLLEAANQPNTKNDVNSNA